MGFKLISDFKPTGDQPEAIEKLISGLKNNLKNQVLLGVTGSGKTFTMANVIEKSKLPTLVISHNKTLAAQLFQEFREFFPKNAVEYFVSYYDYYQPESYIPQTDLYIEKDASINEEIDKLRLSTTTSLMTRSDVIVVASVSCIYNLGSPFEYKKTIIELRNGMKIRREDLIKRLTQVFYERNDYEFKRGAFRVRGDTIDVYLSYEDKGVRIKLFNNRIESINFFNPITGDLIKAEVSGDRVFIYPAKHYITPEDQRDPALKNIMKDLVVRVGQLRKSGKMLEAHRLEQKTKYDLEMIEEIGYCKGIENYSRYFDGRNPGEPPYTLLSFFESRFNKKWLCIVDESHMTVPQIRGMVRGDKSRKQTLIDYGFRLPSALDNRPLTFDEFFTKTPQLIYTSATPGLWEIDQARKDGGHNGVVEQLIRPTGLLDPKITVLPTENQIDDLIKRIDIKVKRGQRALVTTLTKRMAEELSRFLKDKGIKVNYLHSDIATLDRSDILESLRKGDYDAVVGINLLREGLDLPEVSFVAILDADKEGFLRSDISLIQTMGRAARHVSGEVVMYADNITGSMKRAIAEVERRRKVQEDYNKKHGIKPKTIVKPIREKLIYRDKNIASVKTQNAIESQKLAEFYEMPPDEQRLILIELEEKMRQYADDLDFEKAAAYRDRIKELNKNIY